MGLHTNGTSLSWKDTKAVSEQLRHYGVQQLIHQFNKHKNRTNDELIWGDEVEYTLVKFDDSEKTAKLLLKAEQILKDIDSNRKHTPESDIVGWNSEYGSFMLEGIPNMPYGGAIEDMCLMENNLKARRKIIKQLLGDDEDIITVGIFPRTGCKKFTTIDYVVTPNKGITKSLFFPDQIIYRDHPKMRDLTRNLHERVGHNPVINIPVFQDRNTRSNRGYFENGKSAEGALLDHVFMDTSAFGHSSCALQVTIQAPSLPDAQYLYDQLAVMCPIMLALSAATPIYRGYLTDIDSRWGVQVQAMDDRTDAESQSQNSKEQYRRRWSSVECYLSEQYIEKNLNNFMFRKDIYKTLREAGLGEGLAKHFSYNFIKDPLYCVYKENLEPESEDDTVHFDMFNSSTWQTLKLKLPTPHENAGWRIEFRTMDVQMTDKENAALAVFVVLLSRVILAYRLDFVIPLSEVDENMDCAYQRDAVMRNLFHFKDNVTSDLSPDLLKAKFQTNNADTDFDKYSRMTVNQIINGGEHNIGLVHIINHHLDEMNVHGCVRETIQEYLNIVTRRASGEIPTDATWIREFVKSHSAYKQDSVVNDQINYDLLKQYGDSRRKKNYL